MNLVAYYENTNKRKLVEGIIQEYGFEESMNGAGVFRWTITFVYNGYHIVVDRDVLCKKIDYEEFERKLYEHEIRFVFEDDYTYMFMNPKDVRIAYHILAHMLYDARYKS